jgi:O-antigen ligase
VATAFFLTNVFVNARTPAGIGFGLYFLIELMQGERRQWFRVAGLLVLLGAVLTAIWFTYPPLRKAFLTGDAGFNLGGVAINTAGRVYMWELTLASFLEAPWFGTGIDAPTEILEARGKNHPHNDYLRILHHLGSVGLFLWLLFYGRTMNWIWAAWKDVRNALDTSVYARLYGTTFMGMTAAALSMLTDNTIVYSFVMYPLAVLIGLSVGSLVDRQHLTTLHNP